MGGSALQLQNGAYVAAPYNAAYNFGTGNFTLEAWIKPSGAGTIISRKGSAGGQGNGGFLLVLKPDGSFKLATDSGFGYFEIDTQTTPVFDGAWHAIAGVRNGANLYLYLDGNLLPGAPRGNATPPLDVSNGLRLVCGATDQSQEPYNSYTGLVDEVRLWNIARSQAQLAGTMYTQLNGNEPGLVGYWKLDGDGADASPTRNNLSPVGAVTYIAPGSPAGQSISTATAAAWPTTLNKPANTGRSSFSGPSQISETKQTAIGGKMRGGPVVDAQGNVYVGGEDQKLYCIDPNGAIRWSYTSDYPFYPTPAIGPDGTIYGASDMVQAITPDGRLKWKYERRDIAMVILVPPKLNAAGDSLYLVANSSIGQGDRIIALNTANGAFKWEMKFSKGSLSIPGIGADGTVYVGSEEMTVYALDPSNGSVKWKHQEPDGWGIRGPVSIDDQGNIYFCKSTQTPGNNALICLNPDGSVKWSYRSGDYIANPPSIAIAVDGTIYVGFYGMHAVTPGGQKKWSSSTAGNVGIYPGAAAVDQTGNVYFGTSDGKLFAYRSTGALLWRSDNGANSSGPAIAANGQIYFSGGQNVVYSIKGPVIQPPTEAPTIQRVSYDGASISSQWTAVSQPDVAGYTLAVFQGSNTLKSVDTPNTQAGFQVSLTPGSSYTVQARAYNGSGMPGPWSAPVALIANAPAISQVNYDGVNVAASWSAVGDAGVSGYTMQLNDGATVVANAAAAGTSASLGATLDPSKSYTVRVQATGSATAGPWSAPVAVIAAAPAISQVSYDGTTVAASWSAVGGGVSGYTMQLNDGATVVGSTAVSGTSGSLSATLDPSKSYTVRVQATGSVTAGSWSAPVAVIAAAPVVSQVSYDGATVAASWSAVGGAGVSGYTMQLNDGATVVGSTAVSSTSASLGATLDPTKSYTVRVQATGSATAGPWSAAVNVIAAAPANVDLYYNGAALVFSWNTVTGPIVTGYSAQLFKNNQPVETKAAANPPVTFAESFQPGAHYQARVCATGTYTAGPWSVFAPGPATSSVVYTYDELGRLHQMVIDTTTTVTYDYDDRGNITSETYT